MQALARIDEGGFANLVVPELLATSRLSQRDRAFATALVYGVTRMRRALDLLVDRFVMRPLDGATRNALRLGAHQLHHLGTPAHAAVSATVAVAPPRSRGLVNAVLRRVAEAPVTWPDDATRLSYPDWVVDRLVEDLGEADALAALSQMNEPAAATVRDDGYTQDLASQWVATAVGAGPGERVADLCAAPRRQGDGHRRRRCLRPRLGPRSRPHGRRRRQRRSARDERRRRGRRRRHPTAVASGQRRPRARRRALLGPRRAAATSRRPLAGHPG
jgi:16S rRNA (cytosine967-C5)-methyltransferase